ncbi:MAG: ATP-binding protein [Opitutales bacterium]|nr:ATP-binding protein [Opitutales bacterium]NRA28265.1 PAS domain S-box protein [Opitutales bacterium]
MSRKQTTLDRILGHLDDLDNVNLTALVQRLARERRLLETVLHTIQDGILVIDTSGIIQYANEAAGQLIGFNPEDVGKAVLWKMVPDLARSLDFSVKGTLSATEEGQVISREIELSYPDHRIVRLLMVPLFEHVATSEQGFAIILSDITESRESTEELIENERVTSIMNLAAGVAHELGNPLNSLNIHLQLMKRKMEAAQTPEDIQRLSKSLDVCLGEVGRLDGIIENFLDAVRPREPDFQELSLLSILEEVLTVQEEELANLNLEINIQSDDLMPPVLADKQQLFQVFFNIIKNAAEATEAGGQIDIRASKDDTHVFIQFKDTGSGIEAGELSKVFQPYYTTKSSGHGIGMMIVQRILRSHGAKIGIDSKPGVGTAVTLQFLRKGPRRKLLHVDSETVPEDHKIS